MAKLWGGRFDGKNEAWIDAFGASIPFDQLLAKQDIQGSLAHVKMLIHTGIIDEADGNKIIQGLLAIQEKLADGELTFSIENEDIHLNIETFYMKKLDPSLANCIRPGVGMIKLRRICTCTLKDVVKEVIDLIAAFRHVLVEQAESNIYTIMPGYTHLQHAQPISFCPSLVSLLQHVDPRSRTVYRKSHSDRYHAFRQCCIGWHHIPYRPCL